MVTGEERVCVKENKSERERVEGTGRAKRRDTREMRERVMVTVEVRECV